MQKKHLKHFCFSPLPPFLSFTQSLMSKFDSFLNLLRALKCQIFHILVALFTQKRFINFNLLQFSLSSSVTISSTTCVVVFQRNLINRTIEVAREHFTKQKDFKIWSFDNISERYDGSKVSSNIQKPYMRVLLLYETNFELFKVSTQSVELKLCLTCSAWFVWKLFRHILALELLPCDRGQCWLILQVDDDLENLAMYIFLHCLLVLSMSRFLWEKAGTSTYTSFRHGFASHVKIIRCGSFNTGKYS